MTELEPTPKQEILDLSTEEMTQRFAEAPIYAKSGVVEARIAEAEEEVTTVLEDGTVETVNTAQAGDYIVTNPSGEKYVLTPQKFAGRYKETDADGVFKAKGMARAFQNDTGKPATIVPSWGGTQEGGADCMFATVYDPANPNFIGADRYIIGRKEFLATYAPVEAQPTTPVEPETIGESLLRNKQFRHRWRCPFLFTALSRFTTTNQGVSQMKDRKTYKILTLCNLIFPVGINRFYLGTGSVGRAISLDYFYFGAIADLFYMDKTFDEAMAKRGFMNTNTRNKQGK